MLWLTFVEEILHYDIHCFALEMFKVYASLSETFLVIYFKMKKFY